MYQVVVISALLLVVFWTTLATTCQTMADVHFRMPALTTGTLFLTTCGTQFPSPHSNVPLKHSCSVETRIQRIRDNLCYISVQYDNNNNKIIILISLSNGSWNAAVKFNITCDLSNGLVNQLRPCYNECITYFFGSRRRDSVNDILFELGLPRFITAMHSSYFATELVLMILSVVLILCCLEIKP